VVVQFVIFTETSVDSIFWLNCDVLWYFTDTSRSGTTDDNEEGWTRIK
jgi:hypothetical protein